MPLYLVVLGSVVLGECSVKPFFFFFSFERGVGVDSLQNYRELSCSDST
jgi:hypothetical protein